MVLFISLILKVYCVQDLFFESLIVTSELNILSQQCEVKYKYNKAHCHLRLVQ